MSTRKLQYVLCTQIRKWYICLIIYNAWLKRITLKISLYETGYKNKGKHWWVIFMTDDDWGMERKNQVGVIRVMIYVEEEERSRQGSVNLYIYIKGM